MKRLKNWIIGGITALCISAFAMSNIQAQGLISDLPGGWRFGEITKHSGYLIEVGTSTTTGNSTEGTLTTFAVPGSSTAYLVADVVGQAGTGTTRVAYKVSGTFDRDGTSTMTSVGTATIDSDGSAGLGGDTYVRWTTGTDNSAQLMVKGTDTLIQWIATVKSLVVTTDGTE